MRRRVRAIAALCAAVVSFQPVAWAQPATTQGAQGKVVALNGRVDHTVATDERWTPARLLQPLLVAERVRTLEASRASILFVDETQVKLNAGAVLTIRQVNTAGGPASSMELQRGEAWFRTKNPRSGLTIQTPAAAAAIPRPRSRDQERESCADLSPAGLRGRGAFEALTSLDVDLTNSSAHLFLAETYGRPGGSHRSAEQRAAAVLSVCPGQSQCLNVFRRPRLHS